MQGVTCQCRWSSSRPERVADRGPPLVYAGGGVHDESSSKAVLMASPKVSRALSSRIRFGKDIGVRANSIRSFTAASPASLSRSAKDKPSPLEIALGVASSMAQPWRRHRRMVLRMTRRAGEERSMSASRTKMIRPMGTPSIDAADIPVRQAHAS